MNAHISARFREIFQGVPPLGVWLFSAYFFLSALLGAWNYYHILTGFSGVPGIDPAGLAYLKTFPVYQHIFYVISVVSMLSYAFALFMGSVLAFYLSLVVTTTAFIQFILPFVFESGPLVYKPEQLLATLIGLAICFLSVLYTWLVVRRGAAGSFARG